MSTSPIAFCRRQAERFPLGETSGILDEQFREMNETLLRLLGDAARKRASRHLATVKLRKRIEAMLGNWALHRTGGKVERRQLAGSRAMKVESIEWTTRDGIRCDGILLTPRVQGPLPAIVHVPDCSQSPEE